MRLQGALFLLALLPTANSMRMAISCKTTEDCEDGETCVAGDSTTSVQSCVAGAVCGGSIFGNCPSDVVSGQLACIQHNGIYKCVSLERCDKYFGGSCSAGCSSNGIQCNEQGSCELISMSPKGKPTFGCTCDEGFSGDKCEDSSSSDTKETSSSHLDSFSSSASEDPSSDTDIMSTLDFKDVDSSSNSVSTAIEDPSSDMTASSDLKDVDSSSSSDSALFEGPSSDTQITATSDLVDSNSTSSADFDDSNASFSSPLENVSSSASDLASSNDFDSNDTDYVKSGFLGESSSTSAFIDGSSLRGEAYEDAGDNTAGTVPVSNVLESESNGISSTIFITIGILAACVIVSALIFAMYSRKIKSEQEVEAGGFGGPAAYGVPAAGESDTLDGTGPDTPKSTIVCM